MSQAVESDVAAPGGFVPQQALAFGALSGAATAVTRATPLPAEQTMTAAGSTPLSGTIASTGIVGPFAPALGRAIWVTLAGTWSGTVQLLRSVDAGSTKLPVTFPDGSARGSWTGNVNAAVGEETVAAATYFLQVTLASGSVTYRVEQ